MSGDIFVAEDAADLANHFFYADVGAGVARAVVTGKEELQSCARLPGMTGAEHLFELVELDQAADPGFQDVRSVIGAGPGEALAAAGRGVDGASAGHSRYL